LTLIDIDIVEACGSGLLRHGLNFDTAWCAVRLINIPIRGMLGNDTARCGCQVKRRNDPTSTKVSTILGSYDRAKQLVSSSRMIGAILQPATPRPGAAPPPPSTHHHKHASAAAATPGAVRRAEPPSRQGVFEQFQQQRSNDDQSTAPADVPQPAHKTSTRPAKQPSRHAVNGRHKSAAPAADSKHDRLKLAIARPKVCRPSNCLQLSDGDYCVCYL